MAGDAPGRKWRSFRRLRWSGRAAWWLGLAVALGFVLSACHGGPHGYTVNTTADGADANPGDGICEVTPGGGDCSLRAAIDEANADANVDQINLPAGTYALTLAGVDDTNAGGDLDLTASQDVTVVGPTEGAVIDAGGAEAGLDLRGGKGGLQHVAVTGAAGPGVAVRSGAEADLYQSVAHTNSGAGVAVDGGGTATTLHTTLADNGGPGIDNAGTAKLAWTTVTANSGGGIAGTGVTTVTKSVVGDQTTGPDCAAAVATSLGYNLDSDTTCGLTGTADLSGATPDLAPLSAHTLPYHQPLAGSAALDSIPLAAGCGWGFDAVDQRDATRPANGTCDRGAIEAGSFVVDTTADAADANPGDGICDDGGGACPLRAAIDETNAGSGDHITLAADPTLTLLGGVLSGLGDDDNTGGDLDITDDVTIHGRGHTISNALPVIDFRDRVVHHLAGNASLHDMTITGGCCYFLVDEFGPIGGLQAGGGVLGSSTGELTITGSTITGNSASWGGGVAQEAGTLRVVNSTISGNVAAGDQYCKFTSCDWGNDTGRGGALYITGGTTEITVSTIVDNVVAAGVNCVFSCGPPDGGAIYGATAGVTVNGTILVRNDANAAPECSAAVLSGGYNLAGDVSCGLSGTGDQQGVDPQLGPFANNGGSTFTHLPSVGSPAIDAIPAGTAGLCDGTVATDQRGIARPQGSGCDIGSVEQ